VPHTLLSINNQQRDNLGNAHYRDLSRYGIYPSHPVSFLISFHANADFQAHLFYRPFLCWRAVKHIPHGEDCDSSEVLIAGLRKVCRDERIGAFGVAY
jgi:hypothetical protein